ncbi:MAG: LysE family transporter [Actinomycetaceae bacterium]|nr:LysE family transporter [Actinomycetaceae bacterium]
MSATQWTAILTVFFIAVISPGPDFLAVLRTSLSRGRFAGFTVGAGIAVGTILWIALTLIGIVSLLNSHPVAAVVVRLAGATFLIFYGSSILYGLWKERAAEQGKASAVDEDRYRETRKAPETAAENASAPEASTPTASAPDASARPDSGEKTSALTGEPHPTAGAPDATAPEASTPTASAPDATAPDASTPTASVSARSWWPGFRLGLLTNTVGNPKAVVFFSSLFATIVPATITKGESLLLGAVLVAIALAWFTLVSNVAASKSFTRIYRQLNRPIDIILGGLFVFLGLMLLPWDALF